MFGSDSEFCRIISRETGAIVLDSDYAKAPENPFPAAYDDLCDVVAHVLANEDGYYDTSRITIGGFSAGAALALVISATMPKDTFRAVIAFYPITNLFLTESGRPYHLEANLKEPPRLPPFILNYCSKAYVSQTAALDDPRLSPHNNAPSAFSGQLLLVVCGFDPLRDEAIALGNLLQEEGKNVHMVDIPEAMHCWDKDGNVGIENDLKRATAYGKAVEARPNAYDGKPVNGLGWALRRGNRAVAFLEGTNAPYHTKFSPDRTFTIESSRSSRKIKINVFEPPNFDKNKKYPIYLNFHGSVFIIPALGTDSDFCRIVSNRTGAIVLDCDYAKAPEWPFPAAPEDVKDTIDYILTNKEGYLDISRIAIGGFSAGGTLALTAGASQSKGVLKGVVAMYPITDLSVDHGIRPPPPISEGNSNPLPSSLLQLGYRSYISSGTDLLDPRLSPINTDISSFPERILLIVCEEDPLHDEAMDLVERLGAAGLQVDLKEMPKMVHAWDKGAKERTPAGAARHEAYEAAVDILTIIFR
ncbi:unnamed protein product [Rhizoctonia solani]|uniref:Alpha/beta hydrolase fold-3 domain-containing protein n=1 Tax=Rhizoctonia solani TaxID=456999 RepID=A0A8H2WY55_9AGAM|nr:unnamed protein product [Rhizoctonia solani]